MTRLPLLFLLLLAAPVRAEGPRLDRYGDPLPEGAVARFGSGRLRHPGGDATAIAFSPDGKSVVTVGSGS
jgi:hypothetical protein